MQAVTLVGHGSLKQASGAAMIRHAAEVRKRGLAPIATAGFLNFSRPTFAEAVERCLKKGATHILVQPYFLIPGYYVDVALTKLVKEEQEKHPHITFGKAEPFGDHPALAELVMKRLDEAGQEVSSATSVVLMAHGTPCPRANIYIERVAERVRQARDYGRVSVAYMECNEPTIAEAIDGAVEAGAKCILATPYFLQLGAHVQEDLPEEVRTVKVRHPEVNIILTQHLGFDSLLMDVIAARVEEGLGGSQTPSPYPTEREPAREEVNV